MSFDALTIGGIFLAVISGAFLFFVVRENETLAQVRNQKNAEKRGSAP